MAPRLALFGLLTTVLAVTIQAGAGRILGPDASQAKSSVLQQEMKNLTPELRSSSDTTAAIDDQEAAKATRTRDLRAAGCTSDYEFTYVPKSTTLNIQNHLKRFTKEKKTICGWWFWTDAGDELVLDCTYIDLRDEDFMVIYDVDNEENHKIDGPAVESNYTIVFDSVNVVIGLETTLAREERTFECTISTVYRPQYILIGGTEGNGTLIPGYSSIRGSLFPTLPVPTGDPYGSAVTMQDGTIIVCGGTTANGKSSSVYWNDLLEENASFVGGAAFPAMGAVASVLSAFAMPPSYLWVVAGIDILLIQNGLLFSTASGVFDSAAGCGAGDDQYRFVMLSDSDQVMFNDDPNDVTAWTNATLGSQIKDNCCFYHEGNFYIAGGSESDPNTGFYAAHLRTFKVDIDLVVTELPNLNSVVEGCAMGLLENKVAVIGGHDESQIATADAQLYDSALDEWTTVIDVLDVAATNMGYLRTSLRF